MTRPANTLDILRDALHCGEISEAEFYTQCELAGIDPERARLVVDHLKAEDGIDA